VYFFYIFGKVKNNQTKYDGMKITINFLTLLVYYNWFSQVSRYYSYSINENSIVTDKAVKRLSFPKEFKLFDLNIVH
jgi:branched-subunit amino acid transport protein AzlD